MITSPTIIIFTLIFAELKSLFLIDLNVKKKKLLSTSVQNSGKSQRVRYLLVLLGGSFVNNGTEIRFRYNLCSQAKAERSEDLQN